MDGTWEYGIMSLAKLYVYAESFVRQKIHGDDSRRLTNEKGLDLWKRRKRMDLKLSKKIMKN